MVEKGSPLLRLKGKRGGGGWGSSILGGGPKIPTFFTNVLTTSSRGLFLLNLLSCGRTNPTATSSIEQLKETIFVLILRNVFYFVSASRRVLTWIKKWLRWRRLAKLEATTRSPWGPPGVPQGGPQKGAPPGKAKNGEKWAKFFTNPE